MDPLTTRTRSASRPLKPEGFYRAVVARVVEVPYLGGDVDALIGTPAEAMTVMDFVIGSAAPNPTTEVYLTVPRITGSSEIGPVPVFGVTPSVGDTVLVGLLEGRPEKLVCVNPASSSVGQLSDLSDVNTSDPTNRNVLVADGVDWESRALTEADISDLAHYDDADADARIAAASIGDLSDVGSAAYTDKNVLAADGDSWESRPLVEADISDLDHYSPIEHKHEAYEVWGHGGPSSAFNSASPFLFRPASWSVDQALLLPGSSGDYASVPSTNLLDADTAHIHQSIGVWGIGGSGANEAQSTDLTPVFGDSHGVWNPSGTPSSSQINTSPTGTDAYPVSASTEYTFSIAVAADQSDLEVRLRYQEYDSGGSNLGITNGPYAAIGGGAADTWQRQSITFTTGGSTAYVRVWVQIQAASGNLADTDKLYWDAACLRAGSDTTFLPSLNIVGDLDVRSRVALRDITPSNRHMLTAADLGTGSDRQWHQSIETDGSLRLAWTEDGSTVKKYASSSDPSWSNMGALSLRSTLDVDGGTGGDGLVTHYTSPDADLAAASWAQLGTTGEDGSAPTSIHAGNTAYSVGSSEAGAVGNATHGAALSWEVRDGIDGPVVASSDFTDSTFIAADATTGTTDEGHTLTVNQSSGGAVARVSDAAAWVGTDAEYGTVTNNAALNQFDTADAFTAAIGFRTSASAIEFLLATKNSNVSGSEGWGIEYRGGNTRILHSDGATQVSTGTQVTPLDTNTVQVFERDASGNVATYHDGTAGDTNTGANVDTSVANAMGMMAESDGGNKFQGEYFWAAVIARTLTAAEHTELGAWDGTVATEPSWLRAAATFYWNADDAKAAEAYTNRNEILNLAGNYSPLHLEDLMDVGVTTPTDKNVLVADGDSWESRALVEADVSDLAHLTADHSHSDLDDYMAFFNGTFLESFDATCSSDGATVTMSLEQSGGGDLTMRFSDGHTALDCTPADTIALTVGTDAIPQPNYIYIPQSTKVLTKSTSDWPSAEHIKVAYLLVPSATFVQSYGCYINQNWNDGAATNSQGHLSLVAQRLRYEGAKYYSGIGPAGTSDYLTISGSTVDFKSDAGFVSQVDHHAVSAKDTSAGSIVLVKNWNGTPYNDITNLYDIVNDSTGTTIGNNQWFKLVFWGVANHEGAWDAIMCNLPSGTYPSQEDAESDVDGYADFSMPSNYAIESSTGFLICSVVVQKNVSSWTYGSYTDLRGVDPAAAGGGGGGGAEELADLTDVGVTTPTDKNALMADGDSWESRALVEADISDLAHVTTVVELDTTATGANLTELTNGSTTTLHAHTGGGAAQLSELSDVNTSTPTNRNVLVADGVDWESRALVEADISDLGSYLPLSAGSGEALTGDLYLTSDLIWLQGDASKLRFGNASAGPLGLEIYADEGAGSRETALYYRTSPNTWSFESSGGTKWLEVGASGTEVLGVAVSVAGHPHTESDITDLGSYLPKSAGSGQALTGHLYMGNNDIYDLGRIHDENNALAWYLEGTERRLYSSTGVIRLSVFGGNSDFGIYDASGNKIFYWDESTENLYLGGWGNSGVDIVRIDAYEAIQHYTDGTLREVIDDGGDWSWRDQYGDSFMYYDTSSGWLEYWPRVTNSLNSYTLRWNSGGDARLGRYNSSELGKVPDSIRPLASDAKARDVLRDIEAIGFTRDNDILSDEWGYRVENLNAIDRRLTVGRHDEDEEEPDLFAITALLVVEITALREEVEALKANQPRAKRSGAFPHKPLDVSHWQRKEAASKP